MKTLTADHRQTLDAIALGTFGIETTETRNSDRMDFSDQHVETLMAALELAFRQGMNAEAEKRMPRGR